MYPFYLELELVKPVSDYFKKQGCIIRYEIKIGFCRADIVAFNGEEITAIELKLRDWKKAIVQVKNYQLGCDYVYLAIPLLKAPNVLRKAEHFLKKDGIGLLIVNEKTCIVKKIIKAKRSERQMGKISLDSIDKNLFKVSKYKFL